MLKLVPLHRRIASVLVAILVCLASVAAPGCKSTVPNPEQTTERATGKLRQVVSKEVTDAGRREQMLNLVDQIDAAQTNFNKDVSVFVSKYTSSNADYGATRTSFEQMFSEFDTDRTRARNQILDLHFKLASLATDKEWDPIAEAEIKMYERVAEVRTAEEEQK